MVCSVGVFFKVSSSVGHPAELVKLIPNALASYIPKSLLVFGEEKPNVQDLNKKPWTREQVIGVGSSFPSLPALASVGPRVPQIHLEMEPFLLENH